MCRSLPERTSKYKAQDIEWPRGGGHDLDGCPRHSSVPVLRGPSAHRAVFRLPPRRGLLRAPTSPAPSDRLLPRPPGRVRREHAVEEGARSSGDPRRFRGPLRARHRSRGSRRRGQGFDRSLAAARGNRAVRSRSGPGDREGARRHRRGRGPGRSARPGGGPPVLRARIDAPGDAALHLSPARSGEEGSSRPGAAPGVRGRAASGDRPGPCGTRDARRPSGRNSVRLGQRVSPPHRGRARFRNRSLRRDERGVPGVRRSGGIPERVALESRGLGVEIAKPRRAPPLLEPRRTPMELARDVRTRRVADVLARLREPGGGVRVRSLEGEEAANRSGIPPRRVWNGRRDRARLSVGGGPARLDARKLRLVPQRSRARRLVSGRRELVGSRRPRRQRVGMDELGLRGFPRFLAEPALSRLFRGLLRRTPLRHEGGSPATSPEFLRRSFRNWFQAHYPYPYAAFRCARDAG